MATSKKGRASKSVPYSAFEQGCLDLNLPKDTLAGLMGFSNGASNHWEKAGFMPRVAAMAIEGLRKQSGGCQSMATMLVLVEPNDIQLVEGVLESLPCAVQKLPI